MNKLLVNYTIIFYISLLFHYPDSDINVDICSSSERRERVKEVIGHRLGL